jgi:hypothetical protein
MEEQWYNPVILLKPGLQQLLNHITGQLSPKVLQAIQQSGIGFIYDDRPFPLKTPVADLNSHQITVQDIHLVFLWCCCYSTVAINSMYYEKAALDQDIVYFSYRQEFAQVRLTMIWARSLQKEVTWWPQEAARPDVIDKWTTSAANLFEACVAYLLFHEIGHIILHRDLRELMAARRQNPFYETSPEEFKKIFNAELEADQFALDSLMGNSVIEEVRLMKYLGAMVAQLSNFYLLDVPDTRGGLTHPDLDDRLRMVLQQAKLPDEANHIQLRSQLVVGLQIFLWLTETSFIPEDPQEAVFSNFEELEKYLFDLIAKMKNAARQRGS